MSPAAFFSPAHRSALAITLTFAFFGCSSGGVSPGVQGSGGQGAGAPHPTATGGGAADLPDDGVALDLPVPAAQSAAIAALGATLQAARPSTVAAYQAAQRPAYVTSLGYEPKDAANLDRIQASKSALNDAELGILSHQGLVISARQQFPSFFMGYKNLYADHLPLFVSADSILFALHRGYDNILSELETTTLLPTLKSLLTSMHAALRSKSDYPAEARRDVDEILTIALRLLGTQEPPNAGGREAIIAQATAACVAGSGLLDLGLFDDEDRSVDFSQCTLRGHYLYEPLSSYFRAMMWLGRTEMRLMKRDLAHLRMVFSRRQFTAAVLTSDLASAQGAAWASIDGPLAAFVGESDNMKPTDFDALRTALGAGAGPDLLRFSDEQLATALVAGGFGIQRIASHVMAGDDSHTLPLERTFLLFGQRFVVDSGVLSNLVYDRLPAIPRRLMPSVHDVGWSVFRNAQALELLSKDLQTYGLPYAQGLSDEAVLVDQYEPAFWQGSLYHAWLGSIRALTATNDTRASGMPTLFRTAAWDLRLLDAQLASWAELRHDNLLYAKQSYTSSPACEFPDAAVEPSLAFWDALQRFASKGQAVVPANSSAASYFTRLAASFASLRSIAVSQQAGTGLDAAQLAFINNAVDLKSMAAGCTIVNTPVGWYADMFYQATDADQNDPVIADVHTQVADDGGNIVGRILHVGTAYPRAMVLTLDTCQGPRAFIGLASTVRTKITDNFVRLNDEQWSQQVDAQPDEPWLAPITSPAN